MATETYQQDAKHLFEMIRDIKFAMMTTIDDAGNLRSRPMANRQMEEFTGEVWFFTHASAHKVDEVRKVNHVNLSFADPEKKAYVSVSGTCEMVQDRKKAEELWTPYMKMWFTGGLEDPDLALLKVSITQAEYWDSPSSRMVQLFGMAKAAISGDYSGMGENRKLNFG